MIETPDCILEGYRKGEAAQSSDLMILRHPFLDMFLNL